MKKESLGELTKNKKWKNKTIPASNLNIKFAYKSNFYIPQRNTKLFNYLKRYVH